MPIKFRWSSKEYISIAFMLFGACGLFQVFFIFVAQYLLGVGNHLVVILIPVGATVALFFGVVIIFESFAQVERKKKLKSQFSKPQQISKIQKFLHFPIVRPLVITFPLFTILFFSTYGICYIYLNNIMSFVIAENLATLVSLLIANFIEKKYAKIQRF